MANTNPLTTKRAYADLADGTQTHYRICGAGQPVILLHPSPLSSDFMLPLSLSLGAQFLVIAPDTAGYGNSDPLANPTDDLTGYVEWLASFMDALQLERAAIYGSATGAQLGIEFAAKYPQRVTKLVLDNAAHFEPEQRDAIIDGYLPDLSPRADGSHLQQVWEIANGLYQWFPWYQQDDKHRIAPAPPPVAVMHATAMEYLRAGPDYGRAYRAAFYNERAERIQRLTVPVAIVRSPSSLLKKYTDAFDNFAWDDNVKMAPCGPTIEERYAAIAQVISH